MEDNSIDHVFTSPPYNRKRNDKYEHYDDTVVNYYKLIKDSIEQSLRISKGYVIFNIQKNYYNKADVFKLFGTFADYTKNIITTSVNGKMPESHKAVMKQEVADWFIEKFTKEGDTVLDPFAGTGTTGVACKNLNRNYILIEQEPEYVKIIKDRLT